MNLLDQAREEALKREGARINAGHRPRDTEAFEELVLEIYHDALWFQHQQMMDEQFYQEALNCHA